MLPLAAATLFLVWALSRGDTQSSIGPSNQPSNHGAMCHYTLWRYLPDPTNPPESWPLPSAPDGDAAGEQALVNDARASVSTLAGFFYVARTCGARYESVLVWTNPCVPGRNCGPAQVG